MDRSVHFRRSIAPGRGTEVQEPEEGVARRDRGWGLWLGGGVTELLRLHQAVSQGESHRLEPAMDTKLGKDLIDVVSRSGGADAQLRGNGLCRGA